MFLLKIAPPPHAISESLCHETKAVLMNSLLINMAPLVVFVMNELRSDWLLSHEVRPTDVIGVFPDTEHIYDFMYVYESSAAQINSLQSW